MKHCRILVVEDDRDLALTMKLALEHSGYLVCTAGNGIEALDTLKSKPVDLIVSDILMPEMSGFELLKRIRHTSAYADIPVILLTKKDSFDDIYHAYNLGVNHYLPKPFSAEVLINSVETILGKKHD
jgi:DNA-binding response OmpR family regulator